jgi:hypothetical protein
MHMSSTHAPAHPSLQACDGRKEADQDAVIPLLKVWCLPDCVFFLEHGPFTSSDLLRCIAQVLFEDRAQQSLVLLRNTCKQLKSEIPPIYTSLVRFLQLKLSIIDILHGFAISTAPALNFRISAPYQKDVDFSVKVGWGDRYCVLWTVRTDGEIIHIFDSPSKAPYVCFKLSITPTQDHRIMYTSTETRTGPPQFERIQVGVEPLDKVMDKYKDYLQEQLLKIEKEVQTDEDYYDDAFENRSDYGDFDEFDDDFGEANLPQDEVILIDDDPEDSNEADLSQDIILVEDF